MFSKARYSLSSTETGAISSTRVKSLHILLTTTKWTATYKTETTTQIVSNIDYIQLRFKGAEGRNSLVPATLDVVSERSRSSRRSE